jgi:hypothetical protein
LAVVSWQLAGDEVKKLAVVGDQLAGEETVVADY